MFKENGKEHRGIKKVGYTHEALILWLIENPHKMQRDAALYFDVTEGWLSKVMHSDAFMLLYRKRQDEVASIVMNSIPAKLNAATGIALDKLTDKLEKSENNEFILDSAEALLKASGYAPVGQRTQTPPATHNEQNNTFIISGDGLKKARQIMQRQEKEIPETEVKVLNHVPAE